MMPKVQQGLENIDETKRYRVEEEKFLIYDSKTDQDVCMYFGDDMRDLLLNKLNAEDDITGAIG